MSQTLPLSLESTHASTRVAALVLLRDRLCHAFASSPHHARDCSCSLRRLVGQRETLLDIAHFVGVLARRWRVETDACSSVLAVLFAGVGSRAACEATRGTANGCANVPLALLREPPEYTRCDWIDVSSCMLCGYLQTYWIRERLGQQPQ
jgi:hypothetical protein